MSDENEIDFEAMFKSMPKAGRKSGAPKSGDTAQTHIARPGNKMEAAGYGKAGKGNPVASGGARGGPALGKVQERVRGGRGKTDPSTKEGIEAMPGAKGKMRKSFPVADTSEFRAVQYVDETGVTPEKE